jgi:hypothetical protein
MPSRKEPSLSVLTMVIIIILTAAIVVVTLTGFGTFGINNAQGQANLTKGNVTIGNVTLTPQQVAAICNPNNPKLNFVNTTESKLCGIPKTITNTTSANMTTANTTTGAQAPSPPPSTSIAPSAVPPSSE